MMTRATTNPHSCLSIAGLAKAECCLLDFLLSLFTFRISIGIFPHVHSYQSKSSLGNMSKRHHGQWCECFTWLVLLHLVLLFYQLINWLAPEQTVWCAKKKKMLQCIIFHPWSRPNDLKNDYPKCQTVPLMLIVIPQNKSCLKRHIQNILSPTVCL